MVPRLQGAIEPAFTGDREELDLDWDLARVFQAVAARPKLALATQAVGASAATVSRKIAEFERQLGRELFIRESGGYRLTEFGREVFRRLAEPTHSLEAALQDLRLMGEVRRAIIRLNAVESFGSFWLPKHINKLVLPEDRTDLDIRTSMELIDPRYGESDIVIRFGKRGSEPLVGRSVGRFSYGLFEAPGRLQTIRYVGSFAETPLGRWADTNLTSKGPTIYCDSLSAAVQLLSSAGGRAAVPHFIARERGWAAFDKDKRIETEVMVLRKRVERTSDLKIAIYNRLVREMRDFDFYQ